MSAAYTDLMRILTVCTSTNVFGAEIVTLKMLEALKRAGHTQLAITTTWTDGRFNERLQRLGVPEKRLPFGSLSKRLAWRPMWWTFNSAIRFPAVWWGWRRIVRSFKPDVVLLTTWRHALTLYPFLSDQPSFLIDYSYLTPTKTRRRLYKLLARKLSGFIAVSEFMRRHAIEVGAPAAKVFLARSAVFSETDQLRRVASFKEFAGRSVRFGIVGQISRHKGYDVLLTALGLCAAVNLFPKLVVFGTGEARYISGLKQKISSLGFADSVHWMGFQDDPSVIYASFDVCVVPSLSGDPFPTVAMEAAAYGLPVIASRTGGLPEIVEDNVTGFLVAPGEAPDLMRAMERFVARPEIIPEMGAAARERVFSSFSTERMVARLEEIWGQYSAGEAKPT